MSEIGDRTTAVRARPPFERLAALLAHREPVNLASEALSILLAEFDATAGSVFYAPRPPLHVRQGRLSKGVIAHLDHWESSVERRIGAGPWRIAGQREPSLAWEQVKGTGQTAVYSLIMEGQRVDGTICLVFPQEHLPREEKRDLLARFLRAVGHSISLVSGLALAKQRMGHLSLLYQAAQSMASTFDLAQALRETLELTRAILDAGSAILIMLDEERGDLVFECAQGELERRLVERRLPLNEGIAGWVITHGEPAVVNDVRRDPRFSSKVDEWTGQAIQSMVCVPIKSGGRTIGVLEALNKRSEAGFDAEDLSLMYTTAHQAAMAIDNNRLYQGFREEQQRIIRLQENVRRQVARNLHDGTVQFLAAIAMGLDHLERLLDFKPEAARSELEALRDLTRQATQQARLALFELRPLILETQGLVPALEAYAEQLSERDEFVVHLDADGPLPHLSDSVAAIVFAVVQEAVTNAKKHASPHDVWLRLAQEGEWLRVVVEDNGKGFDFDAVEEGYDRRGSFGLLSMRERASLVDGHVEIQSSTSPPDAGTKVILRVPLPSGEEQVEAPETG